MPSGSFGIMTKDGPGSKSTEDLFSGKKVALFSKFCSFITLLVVFGWPYVLSRTCVLIGLIFSVVSYSNEYTLEIIYRYIRRIKVFLVPSPRHALWSTYLASRINPPP